MVRIRIKAPEGKMLQHIPTGRLHSEVICWENQLEKYEVADGEGEPVVIRLGETEIRDIPAQVRDTAVKMIQKMEKGAQNVTGTHR